MRSKASLCLRRSSPLCLLLFALLSGCGGSPPWGFPDVADGSEDRLNTDTECPDLSGSYRFQGDAGSEFDLGMTPMGLGLDVSDIVTLRHLPQRTLGFTQHMPSFHVVQEARALLEKDPDAYARWRRRALAGPDLGHADLAIATKKYFEDLASLGPAPQRDDSVDRVFCDNGWLPVDRMLPMANGYPGYYSEGTIWLSRDVAGGLLARTLSGERHEFTVWCGDGCKGIPYYTSTAKSWARFAPVETPSLWRPDARELPSLPTPAPIPEVAPGPPPPKLVYVPLPDARVPELRQRAQALLPSGATMTWFEQNRDGVDFGGICRNRAEVDRLIAAMRGDGIITNVSLSYISGEADGRLRFTLTMSLKPQ